MATIVQHLLHNCSALAWEHARNVYRKILSECVTDNLKSSGAATLHFPLVKVSSQKI